jgi:dolichol-phosphate mannosyltransferase
VESHGGFELNLELTVKAFLAGYLITEVPVTWRDRTSGQSRFRLWKWLPLYLRWYLYAFRRRRPAPQSVVQTKSRGV